MRQNDVPNLPEGRIWIGDGNTIVSDTVYVDEPNGRVGIGTTSPLGAIQIGDGAAASPSTNQILVLSNTATTGGNSNLYLATGASGTSTIGMGSTQFSPTNTAGKIIYSDTVDTFSFNTNFSTKMVINGSGNVGIGTTNPGAKLSVKSSGTNNWVFRATASDGGDLGGIYEDGGTNAELYIKNSVGTSSVLINSSGDSYFNGGNVGIGTTSPDAKLEVSSSSGGVLRLTSSDTSVATGESIGRVEFKSNDASTGGSNIMGFVDCLATNAGSTYALTFGTGNAAAATEKMRINQAGNVGIGTTNPGSKLEVGGEIDASGGDGYRINGKPWANESSNILRLGDWDGEGFSTSIFDDNSSEVMRVTGGNVGIGTTNPNRLLTVETTGNASYLALNSSSNNTTIGSDVNGAFIVYDDSSATYRMVIDQTTGNIGVNTTNPYAKLHVASTSSNNVPTAGTATGGLWVSTSNQTFGINMGVSGNGWGFIQSQRADTGSTLYNLNLQPLGGNVGIGTTNPTRKLHVLGPGNSTPSDAGGIFLQTSGGGGLDIYATSTAANPVFNFRTFGGEEISFSPNSSELMRLKSGSVGIGTTLPNARLEIAGHSTSGKFLLIDNVAATDTFLDVEDGVGSTLLSITRETGNTIKFNSFNDFSFADNISVTGTVTATNFILSSDETLKDNIKEIDVKHTDVNWKNFELKSEPGIKRAGVIAQELEVKHPEFVRTASDGIKSVAYIDLLITKIAELEARLEKAGL